MPSLMNGVINLVLLTLLIDVIAAASFYVQRQAAGMYLPGLILQIILVVLALVFTIGYRGRRRGRFNYDTWSHVFTLPYAFIILSLIANAVLAFLYYLNYTGANPLIFS